MASIFRLCCSPFRYSLFAQEPFQLVERGGPAHAVAVAGGLVEELLMGEREQCAFAVGLERDRHQRFPFRRALPCPGEHQLLVRDDVAVLAADAMLLAAGRAEDDVKASADAR